MRVVIFWAMCHHSLGHEKKALLRSDRPIQQCMLVSFVQGDGFYKVYETSN